MKTDTENLLLWVVVLLTSFNPASNIVLLLITLVITGFLTVLKLKEIPAKWKQYKADKEAGQ